MKKTGFFGILFFLLLTAPIFTYAENAKTAAWPSQSLLTTITPKTSLVKSVVSQKEAYVSEGNNYSTEILPQYTSVSDHPHENYNPFTGNLMLSYVDAELPGNGFPLKIMHSFNDFAGYGDTFSLRQHAMGQHPWVMTSWIVGLNMPRIGFGGPTGPDDHSSPGVIYIIMPDGTEKRAYEEKRWSQSYITADNWVVHFNWPQQDASILTPDGIYYSYTNSYSYYYIRRARDPHGNNVTFHYSDSPRDRRLYLHQVTTSDGRQIDFTYDNRQQKPQWMKISTNDQTWTYHFKTIVEIMQSVSLYELTSVDRPDGTTWGYQYEGQPLVNTPDCQFRCYDISQVDTPEGGKIRYHFGQGHGKPLPGNQKENVGLEIKVVSGPGLKRGEWSYAYKEIPGTNTARTTIHSPNKTVEYDHFMQDYGRTDKSGYPLWKVGLLIQKNTYTPDVDHPQLVLQENYHWGDQYFAAQQACLSDTANGYHCADYDYRPYLLDKTIIRDGSHYRTEYSDYNPYNQPETIKEIGDDGKTKITKITYFNSKQWVLGRLKSQTINGISVMNNTYNEIGDLLTHQVNGVITTYTYDLQGNKTTQQDALGHLTKYEDYFRGTPQTTILPEGAKELRTVNPTGTIASATDPNGHTTHFQYDAMNRVTQITNPIGVAKTIVYNGEAGLGGFIETRGNYQKITRVDGLKRPIQTITTDTKTGNRITADTVYDENGRVIFESYPYDHAATDNPTGMTRQYDALNRLTLQTFPQGSIHYAYLPHHQIQMTDPKGNVTVRTYESYGDPEQADVVRIEAPGNITTTIQRDVLGNILSVHQGNYTRAYQYDSHFFLIRTIYPETGTTIYTRNALGNLLSSQTENSGITTYHYDARNHLIEVDYPDGSPSLLHTYTPNGNLASSIKGDIIENYTYDANGNIIQEKITMDGREYKMEYAYDDLEHLSKMTYPDGRHIIFSPNAFGQSTQVGDFITAAYYYPNGTIQTLQSGNGVMTTIGLNARLLPNQIQISHPRNVFMTKNYTYDFNNNITAITEAEDPTYNIALAYDGTNRLTTAHGPWGEGHITYNANGDIQTKNMGTQMLTYHYDPDTDQLETVTGALPYHFEYDTYGNVTENGKNQFHYGADGNLDYVKDENGVLHATYAYDGNHYRLMVSDATGKTYSIYNHEGLLLYETNLDQPWSKDHIYLNHQKVAQITTDHSTVKTTYFHNDLLGSPIAATDAEGNLLWKEYYQPFGSRWNKTVGKDNTQWFTGKTFDNLTELEYFGARYYDPILGRFMGMDPIGFTQNHPMTFNSYDYASNNPYVYVDPDGRFIFAIIFAITEVTIDIIGIGVAAAGAAVAIGVDSQNTAVADTDNSDYLPQDIFGNPLFPPLLPAEGDVGIVYSEENDPDTQISKSNSPIWKGLKPYKGPIKTNGQSGKKRRYYKWDHTHGDIEEFDRNGKHVGSLDPIHGERTKPKVWGRNEDL